MNYELLVGKEQRGKRTVQNNRPKKQQESDSFVVVVVAAMSPRSRRIEKAGRASRQIQMFIQRFAPFPLSIEFQSKNFVPVRSLSCSWT